jgi:hypothetical protein
MVELPGFFTRKHRAAFGLAIAISGASCGQLDFKKSMAIRDDGIAIHLGCVQGYVVDGITGSRIDFSSLKIEKDQGIYIDVARERVVAGLQSAPTTTGGFRICNIPLDEAYLLRADLPGYESMEGMVRVRSTIKPFADAAVEDIRKQVPSLNVNIRMYPRDLATQDLKFMVTSFAEPVKGAVVHLKPNSGALAENSVVDETGFLIPTNIGSTNFTAETDDSGLAVFAAADLMLGARYEYIVLPPAGESFLEPIRGLVELKIRNADDRTSAAFPYLQLVAFDGTSPKLAELQFSTQSQNYAEDGKLIIVFNRKIEILPGTEDGITATLGQAHGAELATDIKGNFIPDQVSYEIDGYRLILLPKWKTKPNEQREGGLTIAYKGIHVRPASAPRSAEALEVGVANSARLVVPIFGAITAEQIATSLGLADISGNSQAAAAGSILGTPLKLQILDQFGQPYTKGPVEVTFKVATGSGGVGVVGSGSFSSSVKIASDVAHGTAAVNFKLGSEFSAQSVEASIAGIPSIVTFTATGIAVASSFSIIEGSATVSWPAGLELPRPITVQVLDQSNHAMGRGTAVTFIPNSGGAVSGLSGFLSAVTVTTDEQGRASVRWKLGIAVGVQNLEIQVPRMETKSVNANATQRISTLNPYRGDGLSAAPGTDLTLDLQLLDQNGQPIVNPAATETIDFEILGDTVGGLSVNGGPSDIRKLRVNPNAAGHAIVKLRIGENPTGTRLKVQASYNGSLQVEYSETVLAVLRSLRTASDLPETVPSGAFLSEPFVVQAVDQSGVALLKSDIPVTFAVEASAGLLRPVADPPSSTSAGSVTVMTDSQGQARVQFKPTGAPRSEFRVTAVTPGTAAVLFKSKIQE